MSCAKLPRLAPALSARIAFAESAPKLIAEMLKMLALYGWRAAGADQHAEVVRLQRRVGCSEWLIHS